MGPHISEEREALAKGLGVGAEKIHLKAKTNEGVDAIGRGEAIAAHVVAYADFRDIWQKNGSEDRPLQNGATIALMTPDIPS